MIMYHCRRKSSRTESHVVTLVVSIAIALQNKFEKKFFDEHISKKTELIEMKPNQIY